MSHTPGPWDVEVATDTFGWVNYAINKGKNDGNEDANARIIAAAPDLLAALKDCCAALGGIKANPDAIPKSAKDAILKAEGYHDPRRI